MKKINLILYFILGLYSCSEIEDLPDNTTVNEQTNVNDQTTRAAGDKKYDVLGYGYDVTGEYLHPMSVRNPVLDIAKYKEDFEGRLITGNSSFGFDQMYYGYSASDYIKDIMKETNASATISYGNKDNPKDSLPYFSGNISQNNYLKTEYQYSTKYSFASVDAVRNHKYIRINDEISSLTKYLSLYFIEDLNRLSPDRVVERYGTHVITDFIIGGRYKLMFRSVITDSKDATHKRKTVSSGFKAALSGMGFSYNVDRTIQADESLVKSNQHKELYVLFYGGNGTNLKYDLERGTPSGVDIQSWENSVNLENACLNEINWKETHPIYDFITDPVKKEQIRAAVIKYMKASKINELKLKPLYLYLNDGNHYIGGNHYTTTLTDIVEKYPEWKYNGDIEGYVLEEQLDGTIPLYEYYHDEAFDHYTTTLTNIHIAYKGWLRLRIAGYIYKEPKMETTILYDYGAFGDHYTSDDPNVCQNWPAWKFLNLSGYVYPSDRETY